METAIDDLRKVARVIDVFLTTGRPDSELAAALLSAADPSELLPSEGREPVLVAWANGNGRYALAVVGNRLIHAGAGAGAAAWARTYRLANVFSVTAEEVTRPEGVGEDFMWDVPRWVVTLSSGTEITIAGLQAHGAIGRAERCMRRVLS